MKIAVTGATGFVGRHIVSCLVDRDHQVVAISRDEKKARALSWYDRVSYFAKDIYALSSDDMGLLKDVDALIHLAWPGLPNYKDMFHLEENLPNDYQFIKKVVEAGVTHVLVSGTCFEYGMMNGELTSETVPQPTTPYGEAKDSLRRHLSLLQKSLPFTLQWVRLFYMFGEGQNSKSLLALLDQAIDKGEAVFNMSGGEQLRDYLPVEESALRIVHVLEKGPLNGIWNCCSGRPVSVRRLVEEHIQERGAVMRLNLGYYPYPDYEPMAFWGKDDISDG